MLSPVMDRLKGDPDEVLIPSSFFVAYISIRILRSESLDLRKLRQASRTFLRILVSIKGASSSNPTRLVMSFIS